MRLSSCDGTIDDLVPLIYARRKAISKRHAVIKGTETQVLRSEHTGKEYLISLALPHLYPDEPDKKWPVVYLIDANYYFGMVTDIVRSMSWCGMTQDAIVVGIGYVAEAPLEEAWNDVRVMRDHDLTPGQDEGYEKEYSEKRKREIKTGGANDFLEFIDSELIGLVESNYRVDGNERTLVGHSLLQDKVALFEQHKNLPVKLFLSVGEAEGEGILLNVEELTALLHSRKYTGLLNKDFLTQETHLSVVAGAFSKSIRVFFAE